MHLRRTLRDFHERRGDVLDAVVAARRAEGGFEHRLDELGIGAASEDGAPHRHAVPRQRRPRVLLGRGEDPQRLGGAVDAPHAVDVGRQRVDDVQALVAARADLGEQLVEGRDAARVDAARDRREANRVALSRPAEDVADHAVALAAQVERRPEHLPPLVVLEARVVHGEPPQISLVRDVRVDEPGVAVVREVRHVQVG